jgi:iron complex transport system substrate-binding protein
VTITRLPGLLCAALATLALAACGDDSDAGSVAEPASDAVAITDDTGTRIALDRPARRVVALEWDAVENVLALGVTPVGAGDKGQYRDWVAAGEPVPAATQDVGTRSEPSLEKVAALKPDLIIAVRESAAKNRAKFEKIAPTAVFRGYVDPNTDGSEWERMASQFSRTATLLGREDEGQKVLEAVQADVKKAKRQVAEAGRAGDAVALTQGYTAGKPVARLFDDGAMLVDVARRIGLRNAYDGPKQEWGLTEVGLEGMRRVGDADWLLTMAGKDDDPFTGVWARNAAFRRLPVVAAGRVRALGGDTWTWGGPLSAALAAERMAAAVTD